MHWRTTGSLSLAALLTAATAGCAAAAGGSVVRDRTTTTRPSTSVGVPLLPYFRGLKTAAVTINGSSYTFLVDTGGGRTLITPGVAATLGCRPYGRDVGYRMNGEAVTFQNCQRLDASIGAFAFHMAPVAVFDVAALLPADLPTLHGVLSLDAFRGHVVTIDWAGSVVTMHSPADQAAAIRATGMPLRVATGENGASLTTLLPVRAAHGDRLWFLLDSGNIRGTLVGRHVRQEAALPFISDSTATLQIGTMPPASYEVEVDEINYDGVLGTAFLQAHVVTLDLRTFGVRP